jgi:hypothetical protein
LVLLLAGTALLTLPGRLSVETHGKRRRH